VWGGELEGCLMVTSYLLLERGFGFRLISILLLSLYTVL
jgi:hypothetical protein